MANRYRKATPLEGRSSYNKLASEVRDLREEVDRQRAWRVLAEGAVRDAVGLVRKGKGIDSATLESLLAVLPFKEKSCPAGICGGEGLVGRQAVRCPCGARGRRRPKSTGPLRNPETGD